MGIELRLPNISGNEREQLIQMRSYLYQLVPQLQWALNAVNTTQVNSPSAQTTKPIASPSVSSVSAEVTFDKLKPLIIKSADIVEAYYEEINKRLESLYVAESDFGTFMEKTAQDIEETSSYVDRKFENVQVIIAEEVSGLKVDYKGDMDSLSTTFSNALNETDTRISTEVQALNSAIDTKIEEVNDQISDVNTSIENIDGEIVDVNARIDETNGLITETNSRIDDTNEKVTAVESAIEETNGRIDDVNASIAATNNEISAVNGKITEADGKIDGLTEAINTTNTNIDELIEAKELSKEDVSKLNTEISKINGTISEIDSTVKTIDEEVTKIDSRVEEVDGQIAGINTSVADVATRAGDLENSIADAEEAINETNAKVKETTGAVDNLKADTKIIIEDIDTLNTTVTEANKAIDGLRVSIVEATAHIRSGILYYDDNEIPVYGLEIGQRNTVDGVEVFNKYARFTSDRLSFYDQNDVEVAYISDRKLYITNIEITGTFKIGRFVDTVRPNDGGVVTKWI